MGNEPEKRLSELLKEIDVLTRAIKAKARAAVEPDRHDWATHEEWTQQQRTDAWPKPWIPNEAMCPEITTGDGSGEGSVTRPGFMACTRLKGHRDIRSGCHHEHLFGPERYSEGRARQASRRLASENYGAAAAIFGAVGAVGETGQ